VWALVSWGEVVLHRGGLQEMPKKVREEKTTGSVIPELEKAELIHSYIHIQSTNT
jgi:hypothetical protein